VKLMVMPITGNVDGTEKFRCWASSQRRVAKLSARRRERHASVCQLAVHEIEQRRPDARLARASQSR
jgi:hypothetical protein